MHAQPTLLYLSLMRFPNEKAHSLQIMQNCEAFVQAGYQVQLWVSSRRTTPDNSAIQDVYAHYGVTRCFEIERVPVLDLFGVLRGRLEVFAFYLVQLTFLLALVVRLWRIQADVYYTRDEVIAWALSWLKPRAVRAYEAHLFSPSARGAWLQSAVCQRSKVIAITPPLRDDLVAYRHAQADSLVAHDGIRAERFAVLPPQKEARHTYRLPQEAFIVGFVGRLQMLNMDKGISTLIRAMQGVAGAHLVIVGGPDSIAESYRQEWHALGLPASHFHYVGQVPPSDVPRAIQTFDVCAMPHPPTTQYARYTSPLKLFEYLACGKPIVASHLPAWEDVVHTEENALLCEANNVLALQEALLRLRDDASLRERLAKKALETAQRYTWHARALQIRAYLER